MKIRHALMALAAMGTLLLAAPMAASAATTTGTSFKSAPVTGTAHNGKRFSGKFTVTQFVTRAGRTYAVGTLTGKVGSHSIKRTQVSMPTAVKTASTTPASNANAAAVCPVLHLVLGPLNLNLLGLKVHLNQVVLDITAQSGPGNLLGNLVCDVANLLNGPAPAGTQTGLLNIFQQLQSTPGLLNL